MDDRRVYVFTAIQLLAALVLFWFLITWKGPWNAERYAGTILCIVGLGGIVVARYQLGRSFSITPQAKKLVTQGVYSKIRNPIYVFGGIVFAGFLMVLQKPLLWLLFAAVMAAQIVRARREARVLEAAFGEEYREYRRKAWF